MTELTRTVTLDLTTTQHDDGYRIRDWFRRVETPQGRRSVLDLVEDWSADSILWRDCETDAARAVAVRDYLLAHYLGPDCDGVTIVGTIAVADGVAYFPA